MPDALGFVGGVDAASRLSGEGFHGGDKGAGLCVGFGLSGSAEFDDEEAVAGREEFEVGEIFLFAAEGFEEVAVDAFEADGFVFEDLRDVVGGEKDEREAEADEGAAGRGFDELESGAEDDGAGAFASDEGSGEVEVVFGEELVEIVAGDAAGDFGETGADLVGVGVADLFEGGVDFADAASGGDVGGEFGFGGGADGEAGAVVEEEVEREDVVDGFAAHEGVDAAGVVADHAADGASRVGGGVGSEGEVEFFCCVADAVEDYAGLNVDGAMGDVDFAHFVHVFGEVEDDGEVAALSGERSAGSAGEDGRVEFAAEGEGGDDVVFVAGDDDADGDVAVVGGVGGVEGAGGGVEADFAADFGAELRGELVGVGEGVVCASVGAREDDKRGG